METSWTPRITAWWPTFRRRQVLEGPLRGGRHARPLQPTPHRSRERVELEWQGAAGERSVAGIAHRPTGSAATESGSSTPKKLRFQNGISSLATLSSFRADARSPAHRPLSARRALPATRGSSTQHGNADQRKRRRFQNPTRRRRAGTGSGNGHQVEAVVADVEPRGKGALPERVGLQALIIQCLEVTVAALTPSAEPVAPLISRCVPGVRS